MDARTAWTGKVVVAVAALGLTVLAPTAATARPAHSSVKAAAKVSAPAASPVAGAFRAVAVARVLAGASVPADGSTSVSVVGNGVPATATAVLVTVTEASSAGGYLTVWPTGATRPGTGNLNVPAGATVSDSAVVRLGTGGQVDLYNGSTAAARVSLDVAGYYVGGPVSTPGGFRPVPATRILDTRNGVGSTRLAAHATLTLTVAGHGGVPATGVGAVAVTVAAVSPAAGGTLPVSAYGATPTVAELTFYAHRSVAKLVLVGLGSGGRIRLTNQSSGPVDLVADVAGYFLAGAPTAQGAYQSVLARRLFDTGGTPVPAHGSRTISLVQRAGLDVFDLTAAAVSVTAYGATGSGGLEVGGADQPVPPAAVSYNAGYTARNTLVVAPSANGGLTITNTGAHAVGVLVDLDGYAIYPKPTWHAGPEVAPPYGAPESISCPTPSFCAEVDELGSARTFNGATWSAPVLLDTDPTGAAIGDPRLSEVSCWAARACIAVGNTGTTFELTGGRWRNLQIAVSLPIYTGPIALACQSSTFCMLEVSDAGVTQFDGHSWGPFALTGADQMTDDANAVSCASPTFCLALGRHTAWRWNGSSWAAAGAVGATEVLDSVSCPTTTFCQIGEDGDDTRTYDGSALSAPQPGPIGGIYTVTCTSATFCAAITVASYGQGVSTFDGTSWSAATTLLLHDSLQPLSCADASHCHAVSLDGDDFRFNGHTWSAGQSFDAYGSAITGLSCPTSTFCVLAEQGGQLSMLTGTTWSGPSRLSADDTTRAVSCATPAFCIAVASDGFYRWNGSTWHLEDVPAYAEANTTSISCPSTTFCLSVGKYTEVFDGTQWTAGTIPVTGVAVSCTSATFCAALVGVYQNPDPDRAQAHAQAGSDAFVSEQATVFNGRSWSAPVTLKNFTWSQSISCGAPSYCVATGLAYDGTADMVSTTYSGGTWGPFAVIGLDGADDFDASNLSCHGAGFCLGSYFMAYASANAYAFNGARWGSGTPVAPRRLTLSCPSSTFCVGVGDTGQAYTWS